MAALKSLIAPLRSARASCHRSSHEARIRPPGARPEFQTFLAASSLSRPRPPRAWGFRASSASVAIELLTEATKMRRCPGIFFADGPSGRQARIAGTGLDVWEVIATYQSLNRDFARFRQAYSWLSEAQLRAALGYYAAYPDEIDRRIALNERWTREHVVAQHPSLAVDRA